MIKLSSIGSFFEEHVEKIILVVVGLICVWLLITRVLFSPNMFAYNDGKYSPSAIDNAIFEEAKELEQTLSKPPEKLEASLEHIADLGVTLRLGGHDEHDFREADLIVVSPAVPDDSPYLHAARSAGVPVTTEINLFVERCPARCVGVTGSVGIDTPYAGTF